ncbi:hypothetical protein [Lacticaseibacillus sp. GG6-2]
MSDPTTLWVLGVGGIWSALVGVQVLRGHWLRLVRGNLFGSQTESLRAGGAKVWGWFYIGAGIVAEGLLGYALLFG